MAVQPTPSNSITRPIPGHVLRRRLPAEFMEISDVLERSDMRDGMTDALREWVENFREALRNNEDERWVFAFFTTFLQSLLTDPFMRPLDAESVLGTDGNTYGSMSLRVHFSDVDEERRFRNPFEPNNPERFTVSPHFVVREAVKWLERHHLDIHSQELENRFQVLIDTGTLARLPTQTAWENQQIRNRRNQMLQARAQEVDHFAQQLLQRNHAFEGIQRMFDDIAHSQNRVTQELAAMREEQDRQSQAIEHQLGALNDEARRQDERNRNLARQLNRVQEGFRELEEGIAQREAQQRQQIARLDQARQGRWEERVAIIEREVGNEHPNALGELDEIRNERQAQSDALNQQAQRLDRQIENIEAENQDLRRRINDIDRRISNQDKQNARLALAINETKKALKKRKSSQFKSLAIAVGGAVVTGLAAWGAQCLLAEVFAQTATNATATASVSQSGFEMGTLLTW